MFIKNFVKKSHFFQLFWKYKQYICKYYFIIKFMFSIWSFILKWCVIENYALIFNLVYNIFQNIETNWLSWLNIIVSDNLCNLKTFLMKTSIIMSTLKDSKAMRYHNFMSLSITIMMFIYLLLFDRSMMKSIKILHHHHIKIDIDYSIFCFYL